MRETHVAWLVAGLLLLSPLGAPAQSDPVVIPAEGKSSEVMFPADANARATALPGEGRPSEEAEPTEQMPSRKAAPAEKRKPSREKAPQKERATKESVAPAEMAELTLANRSTDTIWVEANPEEHVLALSIVERPGSMALLPGDLQRNGLPAGGYSILVEGQAKGSPMSIAPGRAYALELSGSLGTAPGVFARLTEDGRPMFETVLRPLAQASNGRVVTATSTQLVTERRFCHHCDRWVYSRRWVSVPSTQLVVEPSAPIAANHTGHAFEYRWVCAECDRVFAGPGECPECDEEIEWRLVAFRCPTHHDVVVSAPNAVCWRCGGGTTELIKAGAEED